MSIECVMCTYNGSEYIQEQLESIAGQTCPIDRLIICDDGSVDNTVAVVGEWKKSAGFKVDIYVNENSLGAAGNFERALSLAEGDYIFFSDQDDVWLPLKVELSLREIKKMERRYASQVPCLVHTDLTVVDKQLHVIHRSFMENQGLCHVEEGRQLSCLMAQNFVTGCTMVINRALKEMAMPFPKDIIMHDYWLALAAVLWGHLGFVDKQTILYRQHGKNTVGAVKYFSLRNMLKVLKGEEMLARIDATVRQLRSVATYRQGNFTAGHVCVKEFLENLDRHKYLEIMFGKVSKQGVLRNLAFKFYLMIYMAQR